MLVNNFRTCSRLRLRIACCKHTYKDLRNKLTFSIVEVIKLETVYIQENFIINH